MPKEEAMTRYVVEMKRVMFELMSTCDEQQVATWCDKLRPMLDLVIDNENELDGRTCNNAITTVASCDR